MPEATLIGAIIGGVIFLIMIIWFFSTYNRLIRLRENVNQAWSNIDVLLTQRYEMLPNLVKMVKSYASHEKELFEKFAAAHGSGRLIAYVGSYASRPLDYPSWTGMWSKFWIAVARL